MSLLHISMLRKFVFNKPSSSAILFSTASPQLNSDSIPVSGGNITNMVPSPTHQEVDQLYEFIEKSKYLTVVTGAGISTPSGIPDYRGPTGSYKMGHKPMNHNEFMTTEHSRKRFWARSMIGWQKVSTAEPNPAHIGLAKLEKLNKVHSIITQNVDRLHHKAGSKEIIDLHGRVDQVRCQCCKKTLSRYDWQNMLVIENKQFLTEIQESQRQFHSSKMSVTSTRADGDAELRLEDYSQMTVPSCSECGGIIKLDVVMFGDNVPLPVVNNAYKKIDSSSAVLVIGTSLEVFSAYRFINRANKRNIPIAIVNYGQTRAEREQLHSIVYKTEANCAELLHSVASKF